MANKIPIFDERINSKTLGNMPISVPAQNSGVLSNNGGYVIDSPGASYTPTTYGRTDVVTKYEARKAQQSKTDKLVPAAKQSLISYDATGKVDAGSTVRNLFKVLKTAKQDAKAAKEEYKERGAHIALNPETNRYEAVDASGKPYNVSTAKVFSDEWAADTLGLTSGADRISENAAAAKRVAGMGVATASIDGSFTRENLQEQIKHYTDMTFGQRMAANVGLTAGNYAADLANAGLTAANALSFGKLQNGSGKASSIYNALNLIQNGASEDLSQNFALMRENSNWLGKFVLDLEKTGIEQIIDRTVGTAIGGQYGSLAVMGARVFGSGAQEAENEGKTIIKQLATGFVRGGVEMGTEKLGGVGGSYRGPGWGDMVFEKLGEWAAKKTNSQFVGTLAQAFGSEAVEELLADIFNPALDRLFKLSDGDQTFLQEVWGDGQLLYDGLLGGVAGALGGGSSYAANQAITGLLNSANAKALATDVATYKLAENIATNEKLKADFERYSGAELSDETDEAIAQIAVIFDTYSTADNQQALVGEALDINPGSIDAQSYAERLKQGGLMTAKEVNNLIRQNGESILETEAAQETAEPSPAAAQNIETANNVPAAPAEAQTATATGTNVGSKTAEQNIEAAKNVPSPSPATVEQTADQEETEKSTVTLDEAAKEFGKQAEFFKSNYKEGQDVDRYYAAYRYAWDYGYGGGKESWLGEAASYLTEDQKHFAWKAGVDASNQAARERAAEIKANGLTGHKTGKVLYQGVTSDDLKSLNIKQSEAHKILTAIAKATGIDIVLTKTEAGEDGRLTGKQGSYSRTEEPGTIYVDINAGLNNIKSADDLANYTMLRTFCHEFTHFIENWNPEQYNKFRQLVFDAMEENGADVNDMIETKIAEYAEHNVKLTYDGAAREIVAQGMTDILPESKFIENLAQSNPTVFEQLRIKLKEFLDQIKTYWQGLKPSTEQARALKKEIGGTVRYVQEIVDAFDEVAAGAVANFQSANAVEVVSKTENTTEEAQKKPVEQNTPTVEAEETAPEISAEAAADTEIPPTSETEEAKTELKKAIKMPIQGKNVDALLRGIDTKELSAESITLQGTADGFNDEQRKSLVEQLIAGVYTKAETIKINVPYDGKLEIVNTPENVAKILNELGAKANQEVFFNNQLNSMLKRGMDVYVLQIGDKWYVSDGMFGVAIDEAAKDYAVSADGYKADIRYTARPIGETIESRGTKINGVAYEAERTYRAVKTKGVILKGDSGDAAFIPKDIFTYLNKGNSFSLNTMTYIGKKQYMVVCKDSRGNVTGFVIADTISEEELKGINLTAAKQIKIRPVSNTVETKSEGNNTAEDEAYREKQSKTGTPSEKLADNILSEYLRSGKQMQSKDLYEMADEAFGGTQAEGKYNRKDAYDAMELAVNKYLLETMRGYNTGTIDNALAGLEHVKGILDLLPTQSVRTDEMEKFQQFSTPPNIAYLAAWSANIKASDSVLEPSAGIGGLASFAKAWGAEVTVNELSKRRLEVLKAMGFDHVFNENAEHIDNILPDNIQPSVVIMNPPFSATGGRLSNNKTSNAEKHIDQALARLSDGGRLVTVLGKGMADNTYYKYWDKLRKSYNIRANISIDGENYKKYGTTYDVQIVVIDKTGPQGEAKTLTGSFSDLTEIPRVLEGIRNDRRSMETSGVTGSANSMAQPVPDGRNGNAESGYSGSSQRSDGSSPVVSGEEDRGGLDGGRQDGNKPVRKRPAKPRSQENESQNGRADGEIGRTDTGDSVGISQSSDIDRSQPELSSARLNEEVSDDGVYSTFITPDLPVKGGKKHPAVLVESAAMSAVDMPKATYSPKLPANVVKNNLSDAQMVSVTYAGQAHEQMLPDGRRKGFFIGDGTGVGKGRQIAGIILDNFMQGRTKAVWISKNADLYGDAIRDWTATTGRSKDEVVNQSKVKASGKIDLSSGILFSTYDTLKSEKGGNRLDQIVEWLGEDFDGVIAFDEAHNMGNLFGKKGKFGKAKGSEKAKAGVELQRRLPNARIVYVSATAATEVDNLAYAERLGLWGQGTAFSDAQDFISKIGSSGLAAMELVIRDMKAMGVYVARSISYNGVNYDTVEHDLTPMQTEIYDTMSRAWQKTMQNVQTALENTGGKYNSTARQKALGNFYSSMQRFYNQVLTSMSMPSVIDDMRRELAAGHSCVLQIVNTNEAQQNKQLAEAKAVGESLDNLDLTPREALIGYLENSFPTQLFEEYEDDDGNKRSRPVLDSKGNPVQDKKAIRQRDELIKEVQQMSIPDGPLEMLYDAFGTEMVAENTGRSRRVVPKKQPDGSIKRVEERRSLNHRTADVNAFQSGTKRILVFSDAGGTGKSYHADISEKNQQLRVHYVLQPGWVASNAVQGFGRTHRSNEAQPPIYKLVTTNIKGQKRFTSTIARRLDQLGALTKGQRDTGSGMFGAKDNLETDLARDSLREFYKRLGENKIEGIDGMKTLDRLGLRQKFTGDYGEFKLNESLARDIGTFLNRILALEVEEQNTIFDAFISIYEMELEAAIQAGTLDTGMENVKADKIEVVDDKIIRSDKNTGAETHYVQAKTYTKPKVVTTVAEMQKTRTGFEWLYRTDTGAVKAVFRIADKTTSWGEVVKQYRLVGPNQGARNNVWVASTLATKAQPIDKSEWQKEWDNEVKKVPEYNEDTLHMLTGALLPIWNSLPTEGNTKVKRLIANDGSTYLGRVIDKEDIDRVLKGFDVARTLEVFTAQGVKDKALKNGTRFYLTNDRAQIFRSRVSGEYRLEISQPANGWYLLRRYPGIIQEKISFRDRFFIPVGDEGTAILEKILADNPVRTTAEDDTQYQIRGEEQYGVRQEGTGEHLYDPYAGEAERRREAEQKDGRGNPTEVNRNRKNRLFKSLTKAEQDDVSEIIIAGISESEETDALIREYDSISDYVETFYSMYLDGPVVAEAWRPFFEDVDETIRQLDDYFGRQYQARDNILSDREVLELAAEQINIDGLTAGEKDGLRIFKERLDKQRELEEHRKELGQLYKEQQFGAHVDREEAQKTLNRMKILDEQIAKQKALVLGAETSNVLQQVLPKARKVVEQMERERGQELLQRYRQRRNEAADVKKYRAKLTREVNTLRDWMLKPDNKNALKHVPDTLKKPVIDFITRIDFSSKRQLSGGEATKADIKWRDSLKALRTMLDRQKGADEEYFGYDLPPQFIERVDEMIETIQGYLDKNTGDNVYTVNQMSAKELKDLASIVHTCRKLITGLNSFHQNGIFQHVDEAGDADVQNLKQYNNSNKAGIVNDFLMWQQMRPAYAFERFGPGGKAIYKELESGQATLARNAKKIIAFANDAYTTEEVQAWEKEAKTFEFGDDTVEIPVSSIMSLYELSKRPQALSHILGDGIRVATYKTKVTWEKQNGKMLPRRVKSKKISDVGHTLTSDELDAVVSSLTERQKEVADKLQQFMQRQGGEWGNHVSRARFGEDLFGEEHYFPINSDGTHLNADAGETPANASLYALLNMGFTKPLQEGADNRIILYSIFDVFSNHMSSMAQYNAFALPVIDTLKWFNYHTDTESVRDEMARVFGRPEESTPGSGKKGYAERFVINFVRALNGTEAQGVPQDAFAVNALHKFNVGKVAYNFRVMAQQPLSITRAGMILNTDDIINGLKMSRAELIANIEEMEKYSGIAAWKGLGFYDVNISRGLSHMIKHDDTTIDKINEVGLKGAEVADKITWAAMWNASKIKAAKKGLKAGSAEFFEEATRIFEEVIYKTQVVDSVLTKNEWSRSKGAIARATSSFMSEATTTVSMVLDAYNKIQMDMQRGQTFQQAWQKNWRNIGRVMLVYAAGEILGAAVTAVIDGFRDDDDYETMWQKIREAFVGNLFDNLNPLMKLPIVSDVFDAAKLVLNTAGVEEIFGVDIYGFEPNMIYMNWIKSLEKAAKGVNERFVNGNDKYKPYYIIYNLLDAISGMTGLPAASATREIITMWNTLVGRMAPGLKVQKYANEPKTAIKYALRDGYLTEEEAVDALVKDAGYKPDEAKHDVRQWIAQDEHAEWDTDKSGTITQAEAFEILKDYPIKERREIWDMFGWKIDYDTYAKKH